MKPVCLVIGAGAGIGGSVARRFAAEGYHACLCRRSDEEGLHILTDRQVHRVTEGQAGCVPQAAAYRFGATGEGCVEVGVGNVDESHAAR